MPVTARWYPNGWRNFTAGNIDWDADTIRVALLANTGSYDDTHQYWSDVSANEVTGTGYTAGGNQLTTPTVNITDSSGLTAWAASTAYALGDVVRATTDNGNVFRCVVAGTSGGTEPTWVTTSFRETADNTVVWVQFGSAVIWLDADDVTWASSTITARYAVIYKDTGVATTSPLIGFVDFGQDESSSNGNFTIQWSANGILRGGVGSVT